MEKAKTREKAEAKTLDERRRAAAKAAAAGREARAARPRGPRLRRKRGGGMTLAYYPGCSLRHSSEELDHSTRKVLTALGVDYKEVPDWTCCGSTPAHMMDHLLAQSLAARNLRQASEVGDELLAPCPSCYQREKNAAARDPRERRVPGRGQRDPRQALHGKVTCYSLPEYLMKFVGEEKVASLVKTDLSQLKVVPYYGCLLGRPGDMVGEPDKSSP